MPKLVLRTPEEYTSFPILVDGTTYDIVTVEGPTTKTATISKATVAQLEAGVLGGGATDLSEVNEKIDDLTEKMSTVEESIEDIYSKIEELPTEMPSLDGLNDVITTQRAMALELVEIKAQISALQVKDTELTNLIQALTARINVLEGKCPCCGCTVDPQPTPSCNC